MKIIKLADITLDNKLTGQNTDTTVKSNSKALIVDDAKTSTPQVTNLALFSLIIFKFDNCQTICANFSPQNLIHPVIIQYETISDWAVGKAFMVI